MAIDYETIRQMPRTRPAPERREDTAILTGGREVAILPNGGLDLGARRGDDPLSGFDALNMTFSVLTYWARWPDIESAVIATLYAASTHWVDEEFKLVFDAIARMMFIAPPGSGKTRMMRVLRALMRDPTGIINAPITAPGLREALANHKVPIVDEAHRLFGGGLANSAIQSVMTGGYTDDSGSLNARGGENEQNIFGALVLGARPSIITRTGSGEGRDGPLSDLFERAFIIMPKKSYDTIPDFDEGFRTLTTVANRYLSLWGEQERPWPTDEDPHPKLWPVHSLPESLKGRNREISMALLAVADRAEEYPGDTRWAEAGRDAVERVLLGHGNNGAEMLASIRRQMEQMGVPIGSPLR